MVNWAFAGFAILALLALAIGRKGYPGGLIGGLGQEIGEAGLGFQRGVSAILSPRIAPEIGGSLADFIAALLKPVARREEEIVKYPPDWTEEDIRRGYKIKPGSDIRDGARIERAAEYDPFNVGQLVVPTGGPHAGLLGEIYQELRRGSIPQYFVRGVDQYYSQDYSPAEVRAGARV